MDNYCRKTLYDINGHQGGKDRCDNAIWHLHKVIVYWTIHDVTKDGHNSLSGPSKFHISSAVT